MTAPADMQAGVAYRTDLLAALVRRNAVATAGRGTGARACGICGFAP